MGEHVGPITNANVGGQCFVPVRTLASSMLALRNGSDDTSTFWRDAVPPIGAQLAEVGAHPYELELEAEGAVGNVEKIKAMTENDLRGKYAGMAVSTSLGKLDTLLAPRHGRLVVSEPFVCTSNLDAGVVTFGAWTHGGSFTVRASFDDGSLESDLIASITDRVVTLLALVSQ